jgi:hypothetical protein
VHNLGYTLWVKRKFPVPSAVRWSITAAPNGGTVFAHGTATPSNSMSDFLFNNGLDNGGLPACQGANPGCDVYEESVSIPAVSLGPGTYFLNLGGILASYVISSAYWDQNNGTNCSSPPGCPSSAFNNTSTSIPSEAFIIRSD